MASPPHSFCTYLCSSYTALQYTALQYTALQYTALQYTILMCEEEIQLPMTEHSPDVTCSLEVKYCDHMVRIS